MPANHLNSVFSSGDDLHRYGQSHPSITILPDIQPSGQGSRPHLNEGQFLIEENSSNADPGYEHRMSPGSGLAMQPSEKQTLESLIKQESRAKLSVVTRRYTDDLSMGNQALRYEKSRDAIGTEASDLPHTQSHRSPFKNSKNSVAVTSVARLSEMPTLSVALKQRFLLKSPYSLDRGRADAIRSDFMPTSPSQAKTSISSVVDRAAYVAAEEDFLIR